jgi:hypothetical protein
MIAEAESTMSAQEKQEERERYEQSLRDQLDRTNRPMKVKTVRDGKLVEDIFDNSVTLSIYDRAYQYLTELEEELKDYPELKGFLIDLSTSSIAKNIDLGEVFNLRRLIMDALRIKHRKLASFIYGIFMRD